jgi:hypothetical protein
MLYLSATSRISRSLLQSFIHVSTAYSNCHLSTVEEKFYDYPIGYDHLEDIITKLDDAAIEEITPKYAKGFRLSLDPATHLVVRFLSSPEFFANGQIPTRLRKLSPRI